MLGAIMDRDQITQNATPFVDNIDDALRRCGVSADTLSACEKQALDQQGYLALPGVLPANDLVRLRAAFEAAAGPAAQTGDRQTGPRHLDLTSCPDAVPAEFYLHPRVLAAVHHVLQRSFKVFVLSG